MSRHFNTDRHWETHARENPYFAVVTEPEFREPLTPETRRRFFQTGDDYVESLMEIVRRQLDPEFAVGTALDFGCGVGRILLPLAARGWKVSGIDISESMLAEARTNLLTNGISNAGLYRSTANLANGSQFDLVHSFIVLQHIPSGRGAEIVGGLLDLVAPTGVAVLHVTFEYGWRKERATATAWNLLRWICNAIPPVGWIAGFLRGRKVPPPMLMENYDLNEVFRLLKDRGFNNLVCRFSDHTMPGILIFAQRNHRIVHPDPF